MSDETVKQGKELTAIEDQPQEPREVFTKLLQTCPKELGEAMLRASTQAAEGAEGMPTMGESLTVISYWVGELIRVNMKPSSREQLTIQVANTIAAVVHRPEQNEAH